MSQVDHAGPIPEGMNGDGHRHSQGGRLLLAGGPQGRIRLAIDSAERPDGADVEYPHGAALDFSELCRRMPAAA